MRSPKVSGSRTPWTTPPRNIHVGRKSASGVTDVASRLLQVGLSVHDQKNAKFEDVNPEDDKYYKNYEVEEGVNNNGEVSLSLLSKCVTSKNKFLMDSLLLIIPITEDLPNKSIGDAEFNIVTIVDGGKEVEMKSLTCHL